MSKNILVTGASSGIGQALCKILASKHGCYVYLGSRNVEKGENALKSIIAEEPSVSGKIEVLQIDVSEDNSCKQAAENLRAKGVKLYAVVNNAGIGLAHGDIGGISAMMNTNYMGPKRVTEAMIDLVDPSEGRIVNVSSGGASMWLREQDDVTKTLFSDVNTTQQQLDDSISENVQNGKATKGMGAGYGFSKAALNALTQIQANQYSNLKVTSLSPGFIDTPMTAGFGAKLTPEQGCVSYIKCLFGDVQSGFYYGSDGLRSPLTCTRDPGTPEYGGEPNPDPTKYNK